MADAVMDAEPDAAAQEAERREEWMLGSIPQLRRFFSGRCITCRFWTPPAGTAKLGTCTWLGTTAADKLISGVGAGPILTAPAYGCIGWGEVTPEMSEERIEVDGEVIVRARELTGPIRDRVANAIASKLMDDVPDESQG